MTPRFLIAAACILFPASLLLAESSPAPEATAVPGTDGYVTIPMDEPRPTKNQKYRAIYNATQAATRSADVVPALNMAGSELNALAAEKVPLSNATFVVVFHGPAIDGILDNAHYKAKYG